MKCYFCETDTAVHKPSDPRDLVQLTNAVECSNCSAYYTDEYKFPKNCPHVEDIMIHCMIGPNKKVGKKVYINSHSMCSICWEHILPYKCPIV